MNPLADPAKLDVDLARLSQLDLATLKARWRSVTGRAAPVGVQRSLLLKMLVYRLQADALGDLDPSIARFLDRIAGDPKLARAKSIPLPDRDRAGEGAILVREWQGVSYRVAAIADGYAWNGATYRSLSEVARAITGVPLERPALLRPQGSGSAAMKGTSEKTVRRCAVYARVSTDHGLEQDFNSLDAQQEAAEAYVRSQASEGWKLVRGGVFSDGGFSGGSLERPAVQRLLDLVRSRGVDIIVVYKVDRLTRSLADFAKLVELFDAHGVSFVSVTQSFNTTTSMGRLTLNSCCRSRSSSARSRASASATRSQLPSDAGSGSAASCRSATGSKLGS